MNRYALKTFKVEIVAEANLTGKQARSAKDAEGILRAVFADLDADQEHFVVLALDSKLRPVGFKVCHTGGMAESLVDARVVFRAALALGAVLVIVAHNHPSGDPAPSREDRAITAQLTKIGELIGIKVYDHIILGNGNQYFSIAEEGR